MDNVGRVDCTPLFQMCADQHLLLTACILRMSVQLKNTENEFTSLFLLHFYGCEYYCYDLPRCDAV
jgi:hypothetical protein